eukprot:247812_1
MLSPAQHTSRLTGALTHLAALATKATHALLLPLGTHASRHFEHKGEFLILLDTVAGKSALRELLASVNETNEVSGNKFLVLNHGFEIGDGGATFDVISRRGA